MESSLQTSPATAPPEWAGAPAEPSAAAGLSAAPSLESLWFAVRRHWALALSLGLLAGVLGGSLAWYFAPAEYLAQTLLELSPRGGRGEGEDNVQSYQRSQSALLKSYAVLQGTLERPNIAELAEVRSQSDPTEWLSKAITLDSLLGPEIIRVSLKGDHSEDVALILNELIKVYMKEAARKEEGRILERMKQLKENYRDCAEKLRERRQTLLVRQDEIGVDDVDTLRMRQQTTLQQLGSVQTERVRLRLKTQETKNDLEGLRELVKHPENIAISDFAVGEELKLDPVMKKHFEQLTLIEDKIQTFRHAASRNSSDTQSELKRLERQRAGIQKAMADYQGATLATVVSRLRSKQISEAQDNIIKAERSLQLIKEQERTVEAEIHRLEGLVSSLRNDGRPLDKSTSSIDALRDEVAQMEQVLKKVGEELGNLQAELPATPRVTQLEPAKPPLARKRDRQYKAAGAVAFGLFGLVFLGVGMVEFRHRRVYTSEDLARNLNVNLLGTLPELPPQARTVLSSESASSPQQTILAEAVDSLRTQLLHAARHEARRVVLVTSAIAGEGKTSLASHLAASLARGGNKTLLIDGDLRNPTAHKQFALSVQPGLAEALRDEMPLEQLVRATPVEGLAILTAGRCDRRAIQALAREGVKKLLDRLKGEYDFLIVDACPVLPVADALLLGQHADAVVLAVMRNFSRLPAVFEAQRRLAALDIPMLGAVVLGENKDSYGVERYLSGEPAA